MEKSSKAGRRKKHGDDREIAATRYLRLLTRQHQDKYGINQVTIADAAKISRPNMSYIMNSTEHVVGMRVLIRLAIYYGLTPGRLLDEALEWWARAGRSELQAELRERASESGEHTSVRLPVAEKKSLPPR